MKWRFNMRNIDWEILKILYEKKSITKTAQALYMTQSAITKHLKAIEQEWQIEVVKRNSQGVLFTEEGKYLVQKANIMMDFYGEIKDHFADNNVSKELLKIGIPNSFARLHMPKMLKEYTDEMNNLQIKTVPNSSDVIIHHLMEGTVDIGIICGDYPYLGEKVCLFQEALQVVTPKGVTMEEIEDLPLIKSFLNPMVELMIDQWWKNQFGSLPHEAQYVPFADIAIGMVESGLGIAFLFGDDWNVDLNKVQLIPVYDHQENLVERKVWMMLSERCYKSEHIMDFVTFVEKYYHVN